MADKRKILVIDDNRSTLRVIKAILEQEGYDVLIAASDEEAIEAMKKEPIQMCLMDLKMPGLGGIELYRRLKQINENITVIIMTAYGTVESAVTAMKIGIENYLQKPLNFEELKVIIARLFEKIELREDLAILKGQREGKDIFENMIGRSKKMRDVFAKIVNIAKSESTVLISGESGTGKEMAARAIHNLSKRKDQKMICLNLAAIPEGLQESELFGFEKGAFTGAYAARKGKFEIADKGTIFLDEIGNTNYKVQAKLLRVIEERRVEPLGGNKSLQIDVRLISATNSDLKAGVEKGIFR
jgi:DNA-binding NtrC family response regulator